MNTRRAAEEAFAASAKHRLLVLREQFATAVRSIHDLHTEFTHSFTHEAFRKLKRFSLENGPIMRGFKHLR